MSNKDERNSNVAVPPRISPDVNGSRWKPFHSRTQYHLDGLIEMLKCFLRSTWVTVRILFSVTNTHSRSDIWNLRVCSSGFYGFCISCMFSSLNITLFCLFLITSLNFFITRPLGRITIAQITNKLKLEQTHSGRIVGNLRTPSDMGVRKIAMQTWAYLYLPYGPQKGAGGRDTR